MAMSQKADENMCLITLKFHSHTSYSSLQKATPYISVPSLPCLRIPGVRHLPPLSTVLRTDVDTNNQADSRTVIVCGYYGVVCIIQIQVTNGFRIM